MERNEAMSLVVKLLSMLLEQEGSDLFITAGFPPAIKIKGVMTPLSQHPLSGEDAQAITQSVMNDKQLKQFDSTKECNFAIAPAGLCRFRVNAYVQQGLQGLVIRVIASEIPSIKDLGLPEVLKDIIMTQNGLVVMVEVGVDTDGWEEALHNTLRQAPDVIVLGEIRDKKIMDFCVEFAQTGHLALATLHANNANQAIDRILGFFPSEKQPKLMQDISLNLRAIVSQRLIRTLDGGRCAAIEILINTPLISDLIARGDVSGIKAVMAKSRELGMQTFDQAVFDLYQAGKISYDEALRNADSVNEVRLKIKLAKENDGEDVSDEFGAGLEIEPQDNDVGRRPKSPSISEGLAILADDD